MRRIASRVLLEIDCMLRLPVRVLHHVAYELDYWLIRNVTLPIARIRDKLVAKAPKRDGKQMASKST